MRRSILYEIWCIECQSVEEKKIDEMDVDAKEKEKLKKEIRLHKYIGETSRSTYERAWEHRLGLKYLNENSYMLKHGVELHEIDSTRVE